MLAMLVEFLPGAMTVALSPLPIIGLLMLIGAPRGARAGAGFAVGWMIGLALLTLLLVPPIVELDREVRGLGPTSLIVVGALLIIVAAAKWLRRPRGDAPPTLPEWTGRLPRISTPGALVLGTKLSGANPKHIVLMVAAAALIAEHGLRGGGALVAGLVFALLGSTAILATLALRGSQRDWRRFRIIGAFRGYLTRHRVVIAAALLALSGIGLIVEGLAALPG